MFAICTGKRESGRGRGREREQKKKEDESLPVCFYTSFREFLPVRIALYGKDRGNLAKHTP